MKTLTSLAVWCGLVAGSGWAAAQQSVTLTTTGDFQLGNIEGLISPAQDRVKRDRISAGTLGAWSTTTSVPSERADVASVAYNGFVYCIGGEGAADEVIYAPLNSDGSLGAWSATTALPNGRRFHASVAYNGYVYVIAGFDGNFDQAYDDVLVAPINADGTLGSWTATASLPSQRGFHAAAVYNGFVYVTGGWMTGLGANPETLYAPIHADGTLGAWVGTSSLPVNRASHSCVAYNGFLYNIGGEQYLAGTTAFVAQINADGSIGAWSATTDLTTSHSAHASVAYNGFIYAIAGDWQVDVSVAPLNSDGSIGAWQAAASLPSARRYLGAVAYNGYLYTIGGSFNPELETFVAPINNDAANANQAPELLTGYYSHLVDLQSDTANRYITINGQLSPGGSIRLQVRVASDATAVFGAETVIDDVTPGTTIQIPGNGRYVWLRLTLDDTGTSDVDDATFVTDIVISNIDPPTAGQVLDGAGADIDSQSSKTTIEANWSGFTAGAGDSIAYYEWAIGTAPGSTNVQGWVNVGLTLSASNSALSLTTGTKFVSVRATATSGLKSPVATSDGVQVLASGSAPTGGGGGHSSSRCGQSAGTGGSGMALIGALAFAAGLFGRRRARR